MRGGTVHMLKGFDPEAVLKTIAREKINFTLFVPTMIYVLLDHPALDKTESAPANVGVLLDSPLDLENSTYLAALNGPGAGSLASIFPTHGSDERQKAIHRNGG